MPSKSLCSFEEFLLLQKEKGKRVTDYVAISPLNYFDSSQISICSFKEFMLLGKEKKRRV